MKFFEIYKILSTIVYYYCPFSSKKIKSQNVLVCKTILGHPQYFRLNVLPDNQNILLLLIIRHSSQMDWISVTAPFWTECNKINILLTCLLQKESLFLLTKQLCSLMNDVLFEGPGINKGFLSNYLIYCQLQQFCIVTITNKNN